MAGRKKILREEPTFIFEEPVKFTERDGKMITNEKIFVEDNPNSSFIGVAMAGEKVRILEQKSGHMTKIRTYSTNRTGYVNARSVI